MTNEQLLGARLRPVYTCDFWCDFWCDFAYQTRLTLPCTNVFSRSVAWIGKKVMTYYLKTPFFPIPGNLTVFRRSVTRLKPVRGRLGQVLYAKSHRNRMKNRMCKRAFTEVGRKELKRMCMTSGPGFSKPDCPNPETCTSFKEEKLRPFVWCLTLQFGRCDRESVSYSETNWHGPFD